MGLIFGAIVTIMVASSVITAADASVKVKQAPNFEGCGIGEKDEGEPDKCDGTIIQGTDDPPEEDDED
jgi:hypothetical protein